MSMLHSQQGNSFESWSLHKQFIPTIIIHFLKVFHKNETEE